MDDSVVIEEGDGLQISVIREVKEGKINKCLFVSPFAVCRKMSLFSGLYAMYGRKWRLRRRLIEGNEALAWYGRSRGGDAHHAVIMHASHFVPVLTYTSHYFSFH